MYRPESAPAPVAEPVRDGVAGNARLTGGAAIALLVLLAAEGATIPFLGPLLDAHVLIGLALIPPVALKLGSTGYRFARYYLGSPAYARKGPPPLALRVLAPGVVLSTIALFGTGVAIFLAGPPSDELVFFHKVAFVAWVGLMSLHVLGHLLELPSLALPDWRRHGPREARLAGAGTRFAALGGSLLAGTALAILAASAGGGWLG